MPMRCCSNLTANLGPHWSTNAPAVLVYTGDLYVSKSESLTKEDEANIVRATGCDTRSLVLRRASIP
jgi:hypothetical protein